MFRTGLLSSTAMTAVALLLFSAPTATYAETAMHAASRDPNTRFLCTYGQFSVSAEWSSESGYGFHSSWRHAAVPIVGHGQTVRQLRLIEAAGNSSSYRIRAGIYKNGSSGYPGERIVSGSAIYSNSSCGPVNVLISPTKLKRNTRYWIEESVSGLYNGSTTLMFWEANADTKRNAYVQTHRYTACSSQAITCSNSSYTSPWTKQTMGPYLKLK